METLILLLYPHGHSGAFPVHSWKKRAVIDRLFIRGGKGWADSNEEGAIGILRKYISETPTSERILGLT